MSSNAVNLRDQALAAAKELQAEFFTALKGHVPSQQEQEDVAWATETLAAASFVLMDDDTAEQVAAAKATLREYARAHVTEAEAQANAIVRSAVNKFAKIAFRILMAAAAA